MEPAMLLPVSSLAFALLAGTVSHAAAEHTDCDVPAPVGPEELARFAADAPSDEDADALAASAEEARQRGDAQSEARWRLAEAQVCGDPERARATVARCSSFFGRGMRQ